MRSQGSHLLERLENPRWAGRPELQRSEPPRATRCSSPSSQRPGPVGVCKHFHRWYIYRALSHCSPGQSFSITEGLMAAQHLGPLASQTKNLPVTMETWFCLVGKILETVEVLPTCACLENSKGPGGLQLQWGHKEGHD